MKVTGQTHGWLLLLFLGLMAPPLYGRGRRGDLDRADTLIAGRRYDEAILLLAGYAGENPGELYRAQLRFRKIIRLRDRYHTLAGELLDLLAADPDDAEKILDRTRQLEAIEPSRGTTRRFIRQTEELARFGHNRRLLEETMAEGRALIDRGGYVAALRRYAGGLEISRDAFFAADHGEPVDSGVRSALDTLTKGVEDLALLEASFRGALAGVERIGYGEDEDTLGPLRDCYARLSLPLERLIAANNAMAESLDFFDGQLALFLQEDPGLGDRNYLAFASRIIRGRGDSAVQEGLLGAAAGLWTAALSPFEAALERGASLAYRNAAAAGEDGDFARSREQLEKALAHCALAMNYGEDWRRFHRGRDVSAWEYYPRYHALEKACAGGVESLLLLEEYTIANGDFQRRVMEWKETLDRGNRLLAGDLDDAGLEAADVFIPRYPREALCLFERIGLESGRDRTDGRALLARYEKEPPRFLRGPRIAALYNSALAMTRELVEIGAAALALEQSARTQAAQAEAFEREGSRLHREARAALDRSDFDTARDRAIRAGERYDASLAIQEFAELRQLRDGALIDLGVEIARLEHEALVREVRTLVNAARGVYFEGRFETAEEYLVRAVNRRRDSGFEEDPEVGYWLTVVRGAMNLRADTVIPPTAPLYAEMSQLLSGARQSYNEGAALIAAEQREEGFARFAEARQKTAELRLLFPVNQEASLLDLRMDQVMDPAAFSASFQRRINEAVSGAARGSVESFTELQNLSRINPGYPGIRGMVDRAEIDMGYRPAPPDPRSLARSGELAATARGIVDRNLRSQFPVALEMMNQALVLDPSNSQAMALKDRLQTELGGGGSAVLNSAAEREYQRAVRALQRGNTLVAMTIVRQLLSESQNQQSRRVKDLQKRIESLL